MAEPKEKSWVQKILPGFFREDGSSQEDELTPTEGSAQDSATQGEAVLHGTPADVSKTTSTITGKLVALKTALEFEGRDKSRLSEIASTQELLLYLYDVVLFKFNKMNEIGLLSNKSAEVVDYINEKLHDFLKSQEGSDETNPGDITNLQAKYDVLKQKYDALHAKFLETGVVTEREIEIKKECNYLTARTRELETFLRIAQKKISILTSTADMVQSLRAKNSLLNSKVEHQARLLKSLTAGQPENHQLLLTIEKLSNENNQMKSQLERQGEILQRFQSHIPAESSTGALVKKLIDENVGLVNELEKKQDQLESLAINQSTEDMLANVDQLQDENIQLRSRLEAGQSLSQLLTTCQEKNDRPGEVEKMLKSENQRLKQLLAAKKQQIQVLSSDPANRQFVQTITRLKSENRQLRKISDQKASYLEQLFAERKEMQDKLRRYSRLPEESKRLRSELEFQKRLVASYRKTEYEYEMLKKKYYKINDQYKIAKNENEALTKKLNRLAVEYNSLVKEYESLFGKG